MNRGLSLTVTIIFLGLITACSKPSTKELLVDKQWTLVKSNVEPAMRGTNDFGAILGECIFDDVETYHANGEYTWDRGENACSLEEEQVSKGTWTLNEDGTEITIVDGDDIPFILTVNSINDSMMVVSYTEGEMEDEEGASHTYTYTDTYKLK